MDAENEPNADDLSNYSPPNILQKSFSFTGSSNQYRAQDLYRTKSYNHTPKKENLSKQSTKFSFAITNKHKDSILEKKLFSQKSRKPGKLVSQQRCSQIQNQNQARSETKASGQLSDIVDRAKIANKIYVLSCEKSKNEEFQNLPRKETRLTTIGNYDHIKSDNSDTESHKDPYAESVGNWSSSDSSLSSECDDSDSGIHDDLIEQVDEMKIDDCEPSLPISKKEKSKRMDRIKNIFLFRWVFKK